jgi:putative transposase
MEYLPRLGVVWTAKVTGLNRTTLYRRGRPKELIIRPAPHNALAEWEEARILETLNSPQYVNCSPTEAFYTLMDEGRHLGSLSTYYRVLKKHKQLTERRNQRVHQKRSPPQVVSRKPNEAWSWDISKLMSPKKWEYYFLYLILDLYSRYVVAWMVAEHENGGLASRLLEEAYRKEGLKRGQVALHQDRGGPMRSRPFWQTAAELGVGLSYSRPRVSNDNPYSESLFKTIKYQPEYPDNFGCVQDARQYMGNFVDWYHHRHRHSGLVYLTPEAVHHGRSDGLIHRRQDVMDAAYRLNPKRYHKRPIHPTLPEAVWINNPNKAAELLLAPPMPASRILSLVG